MSDRNIYRDNRSYYSKYSHAYNIPAYTPPMPAARPEPFRGTVVRPAARPERKVVVKQKMAISRLTYVFILLVVVCAFANVYFIAAIQGNNREIRQISSERADVRRQTLTERSIINESYNLAELDEMAPKLGLAKPAPHQEIRVYVTTFGGNGGN
jgi:hypothetical protein